jgi:hypothetical protein
MGSGQSVQFDKYKGLGSHKTLRFVELIGASATLRSSLDFPDKGFFTGDSGTVTVQHNLGYFPVIVAFEYEQLGATLAGESFGNVMPVVETNASDSIKKLIEITDVTLTDIDVYFYDALDSHTDATYGVDMFLFREEAY